MAKPKDVSMRSYKNKTLLQKFEVAELGNLAGTGPAWLVTLAPISAGSFQMGQAERQKSFRNPRAVCALCRNCADL